LKLLSFSECFTDATKGNKSVKQTQYSDSGIYPVIDQGKKFVGGYTNDKSFLYKGQLPCIIYGDHSKIVKYVDFPFAIGADGVKILTNKDSNYNLKFLYYYLSSLKFPDYGYDRSFKYLKRIKLSIPEITKQNLAVAILDKIQIIINHKQSVIDNITKTVNSVFIHMFGDTYINEKKYPLVRLKDLVHKDKIITYGIVQAGANVEEGVPYIRTGDIKDGQILTHQLQKTSYEIAKKYERSKCSTGDIIVSIRATVGTAAILPRELDGANLTQGTARISVNENIANNYFIYNAIVSKGILAKIDKKTKGLNFKEITLANLRNIELPIPPKNEQSKFVDIYLILNDVIRLEKETIFLFHKLFNSLLYKSIKGEDIIDESNVFQDLIKNYSANDFFDQPRRCKYLIELLSSRNDIDADIYEKAKDICFELLNSSSSYIEQAYDDKSKRIYLRLKNEAN
jgi:type I restriction enzyme S subunit